MMGCKGRVVYFGVYILGRFGAAEGLGGSCSCVIIGFLVYN